MRRKEDKPMNDLGSKSPFKIWFSDPRNLLTGGIVALLLGVMLCLSGLLLWPYLIQLSGLENAYSADSRSLLKLGGIILLVLLGTGFLIVLFSRGWKATQVTGLIYGISWIGFYIGTMAFRISFASLPEPSAIASILAFTLRVFMSAILAFLPALLVSVLAILVMRLLHYHYRK
jgi:hypothetical protein